MALLDLEGTQNAFAEHGVASSPNDKTVVIHDITTEVPDGLPDPSLWRCTVMPVGMVSRTSGGIILPADTQDAQLWTHQLCRISKLGPQVMRGPAYDGYTITDEEMPHVGELWLVDPKQPRRFAYQGLNFIIVNDDQLISKIPDDCDLKSLKFFGFGFNYAA